MSAPSSGSATPAPRPTTPPPTAKSNGSTAPWSTNGLTPAPGDQTLPVLARLTAGSIATTITDTTPPSAAHPPAASTTWRATTPRDRQGRSRALGTERADLPLGHDRRQGC